MSDARPPRFPYVAALLCAACLGAAAWTWMRYSYMWEVSPGDRRLYGALEGAYVRVTGRTVTHDPPEHTSKKWPPVVVAVVPREWESGPYGKYVRLRVSDADRGDARDRLAWKGRATYEIYLLHYAENAERLPARAGETVVGYVTADLGGPVIDTTSSRFTGASVAGLVVGSMGVFVFGFALRDWLRERRKFREEARGPDHGIHRTQDA